jgi:hypothetical protein
MVWAGPGRPGPHVQRVVSRIRITQITLSALGATAASLLAPALASSNTPTCSAHAQLGTGAAVSLTFSCSAAIRRLQLALPVATRSTTRPKLRIGSRAWPCAVSGARTVVCSHEIPSRRAAAVDLGWSPTPAVGDPVLFTATGPATKITLHLAVTTPDDGD